MSADSRPPRLFLSPPHMGGREQAYITEAFESNFIAPLGPMVDRFEAEMSRITGIPHTLALSSGTAAMHLALRLLGVERGSRVFASSLTFVGSISSVVHQGGELVFIDADRESWCMDPDLLEEELTRADRENRLPTAVVPTDLYGQCADLDRIKAVCDRWQIPVVSDAAESLGAFYKGRPAGQGTKAAIYSFNGNKIITTSGGGLLASEDKALVDAARHLSTQARDAAPHYQHTTIGYNYRMSNIVAAIGLGQLEILPDRVKTRRQIFDHYREQLGNRPGISFMPQPEWGKSNAWLTVIQVDPARFGADREQIRVALEQQNIECRPVWKPMHMQPVFQGCRVAGGRRVRGPVRARPVSALGQQHVPHGPGPGHCRHPGPGRRARLNRARQGLECDRFHMPAERRQLCLPACRRNRKPAPSFLPPGKAFVRSEECPALSPW
jgi:dTDP-4-amino-4,6-dideoxygalactose transaminase